MKIKWKPEVKCNPYVCPAWGRKPRQIALALRVDVIPSGVVLWSWYNSSSLRGKHNHSFRTSAPILNPDPIVYSEWSKSREAFRFLFFWQPVNKRETGLIRCSLLRSTRTLSWVLPEREEYGRRDRHHGVVACATVFHELRQIGKEAIVGRPWLVELRRGHRGNGRL